MQALSQSKTAITLAIILMIGIFLFNNFISQDFSQEVIPASSIGADIIKTSQEISKATLSRELFAQSDYRYLVDFSTPLQIQSLGRVNPFAQFGQ